MISSRDIPIFDKAADLSRFHPGKTKEAIAGEVLAGEAIAGEVIARKAIVMNSDIPSA
jgi:hypothetical protein